MDKALLGGGAGHNTLYSHLKKILDQVRLFTQKKVDFLYHHALVEYEIQSGKLLNAAST